MKTNEIGIALKQMSYLELLKDIRKSGLARTKIDMPVYIKDAQLASRISAVIRKVLKDSAYVTKKQCFFTWAMGMKSDPKYDDRLFRCYLNIGRFNYIIRSNPKTQYCGLILTKNITVLKSDWFYGCRFLKYNRNWIEQVLQFKKDIESRNKLLEYFYNKFISQHLKTKKEILVENMKRQLVDVPF